MANREIDGELQKLAHPGVEKMTGGEWGTDRGLSLIFGGCRSGSQAATWYGSSGWGIETGRGGRGASSGFVIPGCFLSGWGLAYYGDFLVWFSADDQRVSGHRRSGVCPGPS